MRQKEPNVRRSAPRFLSLLYFLFLAVAFPGVNPTRAEPLAPVDIPPGQTAVTRPLLTSIRQVKSLSSDEAERHLPIYLNAVVTYYDPSWNVLTVADSTGGIYVQSADKKLALESGQHVLLEGVSGAGGFAPIIQQARLTLQDASELPVPQPVAQMDIMTGRLDNEWIEVEGVIRSFRVTDGHSQFLISTRFGVLNCTMPTAWPPETISSLMDATVRMRAVCGSSNNEKRQFTRVQLWVQGVNLIDVLEPPPKDPFSIALEPIGSLLQYKSQPGQGVRVRVRGVVTLTQGNNTAFLQDDSGGTRVRARDRVFFNQGDVIEAVGYPAMVGYAPTLQDTLVRRIGTRSGPTPLVTNVDNLLAGSNDGMVIQIRARLLDKATRGDSAFLSLEADKRYFEARMESGGHRLSGLRVGSQLQVTGVCDVRVNERREPASFVLYLREASDIEVLSAPSWWTPERASTAVALTSATVLAAMIWVSMLRRRVSRQTDQIRLSLEQEAALDRRYRNLFEHAHDFIFTCDAEGHFTSFNEAGTKLTEFSKDEALRKSIFDLVSPAHQEELRRILTAGPAEEVHLRQELEIITKSGRHRIIDLTLSFLIHDGGASEAQGMARDITERKRLEDELRQARDLALASARQKAEFLANMSHEIRTPMNGVIGMTNLLLDTALNSQQRDFAQTIRTSAEALLTVVNDILDFSKIEAGKLTFEHLDFNLQETVEGALEVLAAKADAKGLELGCAIAPETPVALRGDPMRLRQILTNLVGNSVKFTERGEVMVQVGLAAQSSTTATLRFQVKDTGIGIAKAAQARLFQPFIQADGSSSRHFGGTGLGLAISKQLAELMHGRIGLESEPGQGSTFWFTVELEKQPHPAPVPESLAAHLAELHVLIVDDNESNRRILTQQIGSWRMSSACASNGPEALEKLRQQAQAGHPYDLALLDMQMPEMDGLTLARLIKTQASLAHTRLVILSSLGHPPNEGQLQSAGVAACLIKPVKQSKLFDCLATVLEATARPPKTTAPPIPPVLAGPPHRTLRILLAEDNSINQKVALGQLQRLGYRAEVAGNGMAVLAALEKASYDVILMDCQMPELDGYETTQRIRQKESQEGRGRHLPIIAMTAHAMKGDREKCLAAGMDDYVSKPIRTEDLGRALEECALRLQNSQPAAQLDEAQAPAGWETQQSGPGGIAPASKPAVLEGPPVDTQWLLEAVGGIEAEARALAEFYLEQANEMLGRLEKAVRDLSLDQIEHLAHKLAGASASCGVTLLVGIARELENKARSRNLSAAEAQRLFDDARRRYQRVQRFLTDCFAAVQTV